MQETEAASSLGSLEDDEILLTGWVADLVHGVKGLMLRSKESKLCTVPPSCNNQSVQGSCKYYKDV
jgi:hypothetical protein